LTKTPFRPNKQNLVGAVMKKTALAPTITLTVLISALAGTFFVNLAWANFIVPDWKMVEAIPVPEGTKLPIVAIFNPQNSTFHASKYLLLNFSVTTEKSNNISLSVDGLYYIASWQNKTDIDMSSSYFENNSSYPSTFSINITDAPEGPCWLQVYAVAHAVAYETGRELTGTGLVKTYTTYYVAYEALSSSTVEFTTDTTRPNVTLLTGENKIYDTVDVPLNFTVSKPTSQITYCLDGQQNITVAGNTTLTNLPYGEHNVTVYATDLAGNAGASETVYFTVPELFPTLPVLVASAITIVVVGVGLLVYHKKRKRDAEP
jgi:hypothetical protein